MSKGSNGNAASSGAASRKPPKSITEAEYLDQQARQAREAINRVIDQIRDLGGQAADPRPYVERYPWISMGAAIAAGFVAATAVTPARGQAVGQRLSSLVSSGGGGGQKSAMRFISTPLLRLARTALVGAMSGGLGGLAGARTREGDDQKRPPSPVREPATTHAGPPVAPGGVAMVSAGGGSVPQESPRQQNLTP
jgi:hypothetical protein